MKRYLGQWYFGDSVGRTEWKGSFRNRLMYVYWDILRGKPGEQISFGQYDRREKGRHEKKNGSMNQWNKGKDDYPIS